MFGRQNNLSPYQSGGFYGQGGGPSRDIQGVTMFLALAVAIWASPSLFHLTKDWMADLTAQAYGLEWVQVGTWLWAAVCAGLVYYVSRIGITSAITTAMLAGAERFLF